MRQRHHYVRTCSILIRPTAVNNLHARFIFINVKMYSNNQDFVLVFLDLILSQPEV